MAITQSNDTPQKTGNLTAFGHSYIAGSSQADSGLPNVYQNSMLAKLCGLLGIHEQNITNLSMAASNITRRTGGAAGSSYGGWAGALAFIYPNNSASMNSVNDVVKSDKIIPGVGSAIIVHGINDVSYGMSGTLVSGVDAMRGTNNNRAGQNAYRCILSRLRAGVVFCSQTIAGTVTWTGANVFGGTLANGFGDTTFTGVGWSDVIQTTGNSGSAYKTNATAGQSFTLTLPNHFTGGTVAVNLIGWPNGVTYLSGSMTSIATTASVNSIADFTGLTTAIIKIDSEEMAVTAGMGTLNWTVTRGVNGTTAAAHSASAVVSISTTAHYITWSGTASTATGTTYLSGQGTYYEYVPVTKRFVLTSADAGKTIIGTLGQGTNCSLDSSFRFNFDCWWLESASPPPVVLLNIPYFNSNGFISYYAAWNTAIAAVAAEFDNYVQIADVYTPWYNQAGTGVDAIYAAAGGTITTTNTALYDTTARKWQLDNGSVGAVITCNSKTLTITASIGDRSGTATAAVTTTNTTLTDTRLTSIFGGTSAVMTTNCAVGTTVTCNGKTLVVTSNTGTTFTGSGWSGGGNPGNGFAWSIPNTVYGSGGWSGGSNPGNGFAYEATSIPFTANNSNYTPSVGQSMTWGGYISGEIATVTSVTGTSPSLTLGIRRGQLNSSKVNNITNILNSTLFFGSMDWMHTDNVHPNEKGHSVCAETMYRAFQSMPIMSDYQLADAAGNWSQYSQTFTMGFVDNSYYYPDCTVAASTSSATIGKQYAIPFYVQKPCILTEIGCFMGSVALGAGGVIRFGIYFPDYTHARPGNLIQDFGTQAATSTNAQVTKTGCYQVLRPGWYWLSAVQQVAATGGRWDRISGLNWPNLSNTTVLGAQAADPVGYSQTGITGALANWSTTKTIEYPTGTVGTPRIYLRLRSVHFG